jgi:SAM-dependent methyltransferase
MDNFRTKIEYHTRELVERYEGKRFRGVQGSIKNRNDWRAIRRALAVVRPGERLLNIPCGTGRFFPEFKEAGYPMLAADYSPAMLSYAQERYGSCDGTVTYGRFDIERLPLRDGAFDATVVIRFFHLLDDDETYVRILRELRRVTRDWIIITTNHKYTLKYLVERLRGRKNKRKLSYARTRGIVEAAGLRIERVFATGYPFSSNWVLLLRPEPGSSSAHPLTARDT